MGEFLEAEVGAEARLSNDDIGELERDLVGEQRVVAVGDVAKGTGMHQRRLALHRLHDVREQRVFEQHRHRAGDAQILRGDEAAVLALRHDDSPDPLPEVSEIAGERQDRHDLRGRRDDEARLARHPVLIAAKAGNNVAERAVVDVERPRPRDEAGTHFELTMKDGRIDNGRQEVVRRLHGMDVAGEVEIDFLHGDDLRHAAAGATALDTEQRPGRGLPQTERHAGPDAPEPLGQADGARGLALPCSGRRDRGDDHQLSIRSAFEALQGVEADLGLVRAVGDHLRVQQTELPTNLQYGSKSVRMNGFERFRCLTHAPSCAASISFDLGFAASSSLTSKFATSSAEPARSSVSPQRHASRYASISVDPSFIANASMAAWKRSGSMRFTSPLSSQALTCAGMCFQNITWYFAITRPPRRVPRAASRAGRTRRA